MKNKFLLTATLVAAMTLATPLVANAAEAEGGTWKSNATGWWYEYKDGSYVTNDFLTDKDGKTYYFKDNGYMATGWQYVGEEHLATASDGPGSYYGDEGTITSISPRWYYFTGSGVMVTGWAKIDGKWYYFNQDKESPDYGLMAQDDIIEIGEGEDAKKQVFAPSGQWVSGWTYDYYRNPIDGSIDSDGWYYANADGTPYDYDKDDSDPENPTYGGWLSYNGAWYYINEDGDMAADASFTDSKSKDKEKTYYVGPNGMMQTGWVKTGNHISQWKYYNADGSAYGQMNPKTGKYDNSWLLYNGAWYYIENGNMVAGQWRSSADGKIDYYLGADGKLPTGGWYNASTQSGTSSTSSWMYFNADGSKYTGWVFDNGKWYFIEDSIMAADQSVHCYAKLAPKAPVKPVGPSYSEYFGDFDYSDPAVFESDAYKKAQDAYKKAQEEYKKANEKYVKAYNQWYKENAAFDKAQRLSTSYIFDSTGAMVTGWYYVKSTTGGQLAADTWYYAAGDGQAHDGWLLYKGAWYYIDHGRMLENCYTPDGYWVGADGVWR